MEMSGNMAKKVCSMGEIGEEEQKVLMLEILRFIDNVCRKNDIRYSLIAGSLIGAIRHKGYIPWDDDIDIVLTKDNYQKLVAILNKESGRYQTLKKGLGGEKISFTKMIDTKTVLIEGDNKMNMNYGIFVDIFCYCPTSNNEKERARHYRIVKTFVSLFGRRKLDFRNKSMKQNILRFAKNCLSKILGYRLISRMMQKAMNKYDGTDYLFLNWPFYGFKKEVQLRKNTEEYIDVPFENMTAMVFKNYDAILRTTFGDYMQLPPERERVGKHELKAYWKNEQK